MPFFSEILTIGVFIVHAVFTLFLIKRLFQRIHELEIDVGFTAVELHRLSIEVGVMPLPSYEECCGRIEDR